jgi:undecaprenyl-diphosphatase
LVTQPSDTGSDFVPHPVHSASANRLASYIFARATRRSEVGMTGPNETEANAAAGPVLRPDPPAHPAARSGWPQRRPLFWLGGGVVALLFGFGLLAEEVAEGDTSAFDRAILLALRENADKADPIGPMWVEEAARDITALGSFSVLGLILCAIVGYLYLSGRARTGMYLGFAVVCGALISTVLKMAFDRPRPDFAASARVFTASFPSGHALVSAVVYLTLAALLAESAREPKFRVFFIGAGVALTVIVGLSRIYLGVHYPTDVLAGWSIGTAWALACAMGLRLWREAR